MTLPAVSMAKAAERANGWLFFSTGAASRRAKGRVIEPMLCASHYGAIMSYKTDAFLHHYRMHP